ncbi:hypothetical protein OPV22_018382 [Ensete ventricosum]|uniref:O-acyltransferase WSD1 C-terminal domain-containing protein n=1 Tax=Ensete ventricosum TaxID=4639 RepID=A0AAV8QU46_ENSVE|nr:hypothetical protein OPV22_018382 [Ensete ventricosum]
MVVEEEPVSPLTRLFHQPCLNCYTLGIMGVGKPLDVDVVKSGLEATLVRHPCFSSIPAKATADRKKNSLEAIFTYKGAELIVKCFGIKAAAALRHRVLSNMTLSLSNMMGPVEQIVLYDHPLVYFALSVFGHPQHFIS